MKKYLDKKLLKLVLLFYVACFLISILSRFIIKATGRYTSFTWGELFMNNFYNYVIKLSFILIGVFLSQFILKRKKAVIFWSVIIHGSLALMLSFYAQFGQILIGNWIYGEAYELSFKLVFDRGIAGVDYNFFIYFSIITIVYAYNYFQKQKDAQVNESNLKSQLLDSKIQALQGQLQPHFLFNTLNDISSLIDISTEKSQNAIADLSDLLRSTLQINEAKFISLDEEITLLNKYLDIEKMRFNEKMAYDISIDKGLLKEQVPPLILQPIIENSLKHGFSLSHDAISIQVTIKKEGNNLYYRIVNNGAVLEQSPPIYGTGTSNIIKRLETLFLGDFYFTLQNLKNDLGVETQIKFPIQRDMN